MIKVIGLMELTDQNAFAQYRAQVSNTVEQYKGVIKHRGEIKELFWNELGCSSFSAFVELEFPSIEDANLWANSPEYQSLVPIRSKAMKLTLFSVSI